MDLAKVPNIKKAKKKPVMDELDRVKQAEKKRRRLEKALKTSAAIRAELEKKKLKNKEEQQRLDDGGVAIPEAVVLRVLPGDDLRKQVKDDLDRVKQAEKKRRRLEKALATSAAIRSELEKKKLKKKEEQQRLDDEGAAIAEAVALHVLLGEDSDEGSGIVLKKDEDFDNWHNAPNIGFLMNGSALCHQNLKRRSFKCVDYFANAYGPASKWNHFEGINHSFSSWSLENNSSFPYSGNGEWSPDGISAGLIAAQVVSALQIREDTHVDPVFFNRY